MNVQTSPVLPCDGLGRLLFKFTARVVLGVPMDMKRGFFLELREEYLPSILVECSPTNPVDALVASWQGLRAHHFAERHDQCQKTKQQWCRDEAMKTHMRTTPLYT